LIYFFIHKNDYVKEMEIGASTSGTMLKDYHVIRFKNEKDITFHLKDFIRYDKSSYIQTVQRINNDEVFSTIKNTDSSGRQLSRFVINKDGWSFLAKFIEGTTSLLDSIYCEDHNGNRETQHYCMFFDAQGNQLLTQQEIDASCVKSVFTIIPNEDIEIVSGEIHQYERPTSDMRMHTLVGAFMPDGTVISAKPFVQNLNMKFKDKAKAIVTDGRSPKLLRKEFAGLPFDANQIQIVVNHEAGVRHNFMVETEYYRA
jgi:hypothetical protein